jgi:hypothetical protein
MGHGTRGTPGTKKRHFKRAYTQKDSPGLQLGFVCFLRASCGLQKDLTWSQRSKRSAERSHLIAKEQKISRKVSSDRKGAKGLQKGLIWSRRSKRSAERSHLIAKVQKVFRKALPGIWRALGTSKNLLLSTKRPYLVWKEPKVSHRPYQLLKKRLIYRRVSYDLRKTLPGPKRDKGPQKDGTRYFKERLISRKAFPNS